MKNTLHPSLRFLGLVTATFASLASAAVNAETPPGEVQSSFTSPRGTSEFCSIPRVLDLASTRMNGALAYFPFGKSELKSAKKVCGVDFYDTRESTAETTAAVICPKLGSTNPAVMAHELPNGTSRADFIANECPKAKGRSGDLIAKYKQSVSCSYTPSILGYPRIARALRSEIEIPFSAYRSMDRLEHLAIATEAKELASRVSGDDSLIAQTWRTIYRDDLNPAASPRRSVLYRENDTLLFGGLVPETKGEEFYAAANGATKGDRVANFQATAAFRAVTNAAPVSAWGIGKEFNAENAQRLLLLREMGDLIVLDTLLNQQDRFGNLHYREHYVRMAADGTLDWEFAKQKDGAFDPAQAAKLTAAGYVRVKRMLMADNDCGVAKENKMARANEGRGIAALLTHLHPDTYLAIQNMQKLATDGLLARYLKEELLFGDLDVTSVRLNLVSLATTLKRKCLAGELHLDADIVQVLGSKPAIDSVAFCKAN